MPHSLALFPLRPISKRAQDVVNNASNKHLVSTWDGELVLDIGHVSSASGNTTLATLGRNGDVYVEGSSISKIQCSFEIDPTTKVVMFFDRSHGQTSQVSGPDATPFEHGRIRKVVVQQYLNTIIGMGGVKRNLVQFQLIWHLDTPTETMEQIKTRGITVLEENPRLARTIDEANTVMPSQWMTRVHTPGCKQPTLRYHKLPDMLGAGQFGEVYKAIDTDTGRLMAVKILQPPAEASRAWMRALKREVENLSSISHPHIVDYIASEDWNESSPKIFMGLKDVTLRSLIKRGCSVSVRSLGQSVFHHILQALDYLTTQGIIHRDVKPDNILYTLGHDH